MNKKSFGFVVVPSSGETWIVLCLLLFVDLMFEFAWIHYKSTGTITNTVIWKSSKKWIEWMQIMTQKWKRKWTVVQACWIIEWSGPSTEVSINQKLVLLLLHSVVFLHTCFHTVSHSNIARNALRALIQHFTSLQSVHFHCLYQVQLEFCFTLHTSTWPNSIYWNFNSSHSYLFYPHSIFYLFISLLFISLFFSSFKLIWMFILQSVRTSRSIYIFEYTLTQSHTQIQLWIKFFSSITLFYFTLIFISLLFVHDFFSPKIS